MADLLDRCMVCFRILNPTPLTADTLEKCPLCQGWFCSRCLVRRGGRSFCEQRCGDTYFFAGEDEEGDIDGE
jgi:hypothetical protein